ncbi:hypothetical protein Tsubulata_033307 [Turnera subulata]|uniref:Pentacotripeptide-repeat region of PRORP domain-containing protein n=1 Tax=Turnera subulata TaxID=218843 RepID=A0A9Q0FR11_9ROSI|nr:hypothetical protein Tsubulata_033307 [Turnera subulata]
MSSTELLYGGIGSPPYPNPERGRASSSSSSSSSSTFHGLKRCSNMRELKQYHSQIIRLGLSADNNASSRLIKFCALSKNGDFSYALKLFDTIPHPDAFLYNLIFKGYLLQVSPSSPLPRHHRITLLLYSHMLQHSASPPNSFTFPSLARACGLSNNVGAAKQIHAHLFKFGFGADACCSNNLIHMYVSLGKLREARRVFDAMPRRDSVSCVFLVIASMDEDRKMILQ